MKNATQTRRAITSTPLRGSFALRPICALIAALVATPAAFAAPITLAQIPAGNGGREPAPNLIISVDDSGSMGSAGMASLRTALTNAFSTSAVADDSIRLGFQAMWRCRGLSATPYKSSSATSTCPDTRVQSFSGTHRANFNSWVSSLTALSGTPSHQMMKLVDSYMRNTTGVWSPFADKPGVTEGTAQKTCRKTFHIFMTDGGWKDTADNNTPPRTTLDFPGDYDATVHTFPDGKVYDPFSNTVMEGTRPMETQTRIYRDTFNPTDAYGTVRNVAIGNSATSRVSSLSDWAFMMWATDYAPSIANEQKKIIRKPGDWDVGLVGSPFIITEYWNPRNNPMTWQGITTYTIGFNASVTLPTANTKLQNYKNEDILTDKFVMVPGWNTTEALPMWGTSLQAMMRGDTVATLDDSVAVKKLQWANPLQGQLTTVNSLDSDAARSKDYELWRMALNSRGKYVPAVDGAALSAAFAEIVNQVIADTSAPTSSIAANTQKATTSTKVFVAGYDAANWKGYVNALPLLAGNNLSSTPTWSAAARLDLPAVTPSSRVILSHNGTSGINFAWTNLNADQKTDLKASNTDAIAQERLDYLRGDRTKEESASGAYRNRDSRLGDIVNSNIWVAPGPQLSYSASGYSSFKTTYKNRTEMLYVGANDGMLHGFSTTTGDELLAYVPLAMYPKLREYTIPGYNSGHKYYVDGSPFTGDFYNGSSWKTALVGVLGGGGKGYYVLDATDPAQFSATNASSIVLMDTTATTDPDIGHIYSETVVDTSNAARTLQISKLNDGRWAYISGNGVNSTNEYPVLLIQYLDGDKSLKKIVLDNTGNDNGLAAPQLIDLDGNGTIDVAYAGDLQGNFWKIDLSSATASNWANYYAASPMFIAKDSANTRQPITSVAQWAVHPLGGLMLSFGTGREYSVNDRTTVSTQTIYGVWDNMTMAPKAATQMTSGTVVANGRSDLVEQTRTATVIGFNSQSYDKTTSNPVAYTTTATTKRGWYFDLPNTGERVVFNGGMLDPRLVYHRSRIPGSGAIGSGAVESCVPPATDPAEYLSIFDIINGATAKKPVFDNDGGGFTGSETVGLSRWKSGKGDRLLLTTSPGRRVSISSDSNGNNELGAGSLVSELGWRQLQ